MNQSAIQDALKHVSLIGLVGRPGSGKQATCDELLKDRRTYAHITMHDLVHREITDGTDAGMTLKHHQNTATQPPDVFMVDFFLHEVVRHGKLGKQIIIADGFPQTTGQQDLLKLKGIEFHMFYIELSRDQAIERMQIQNRKGENHISRESKQDFFETQSLPMIERFRAVFPHSFMEIKGTLPPSERARLVFQSLVQFGVTLRRPKVA